ncbi:transcriptional regulator [gamma proteobacterium HTCC5015]|nr:transcriptional regulator [gamma proteobacterium HTCC5015]
MPRKPKQARSKATVEAIVEAGFICVAENGLAGTTTRHIAEKAGISVGSLYEYFKDKQQVYEAMTRHFIDKTVQTLEPMIPQLVELDIADAIERIFSEFKEILSANDDRYLRVAHQALMFDAQLYLDPLSKSLSDLIMQYLMHHPELLRVRNIKVMSYILINGSIFTVLRHMRDPNPPITFEQLARGLADMIDHYVAYELSVVDQSE